MRLTPSELSFNSANAWEDIYGHRSGDEIQTFYAILDELISVGLRNMHKDPIHVGSVDPIPGVTTLTMADDQNHARQRRALAYAFSQKALTDQEDLIQGYVDTLMSKLKLKADTGEVINIVGGHFYSRPV